GGGGGGGRAGARRRAGGSPGARRPAGGGGRGLGRAVPAGATVMTGKDSAYKAFMKTLPARGGTGHSATPRTTLVHPAPSKPAGKRPAAQKAVQPKVPTRPRKPLTGQPGAQQYRKKPQ